MLTTEFGTHNDISYIILTKDAIVMFILIFARSPLSDKVFNKNYSKLNRLHWGSFRSKFNRFTLDTSITTPVSVSPTHHLTAGSHTHRGRMWINSRERYDDWKRSMDRWENAIRTQYYATVDS